MQHNVVGPTAQQDNSNQLSAVSPFEITPTASPVPRRRPGPLFVRIIEESSDSEDFLLESERCRLPPASSTTQIVRSDTTVSHDTCSTGTSSGSRSPTFQIDLPKMHLRQRAVPPNDPKPKKVTKKAVPTVRKLRSRKNK